LKEFEKSNWLLKVVVSVLRVFVAVGVLRAVEVA